MTQRQEAAGPSAAPPLGPRYRTVAACLAVYAVLTPLIVAALAGPVPLRVFGTVALAASLLGPGLATMLVSWRGLSAIAAAFAARPDAEPQQAVLRVFVSGAALVYVGGLALSGVSPDTVQLLLALVVADGFVAWLVLLHLMVVPAGQWRRGLAMAFDVGFITAFLHWGDAATAPWVAAYLWVSCGCALSFGGRMLAAAAFLSSLGFAAVATMTPIWQASPLFIVAFCAALGIAPLYAGALARRYAAVRDEAEHTKAEKGRLLAIMSHELRTPLNTLIGMGSLIARTKLDGEQREMLGTMQLAARTLLGLINDLLDLSKLEAGKVAAKTESFVLREVLGGAVAILRPQAEAKGLEIALIIDPRLPHVCRGMPLQLRQVVMNLLANAIKFTPRGHVSLAATLAERDEGTVRLRLTVRDEGIGIPPATRERIFAQADETVANRFGGAGLGLAIAKELVELMGGTISVESEIGAGTAVSVELPLSSDEAAEVRPPDLIGRRVVIVSADRELAGTVQTWLKAWRSETRWYADGDDALAALGGEHGQSRHILLIDGRNDPLASLSLSHRLATASAHRPTILFIAPPQASEAVAGLAATQLAAVIEEPISEAALASAFLSMLAAATDEPPELVDPIAAGPRGYRILVADDNAANRDALKNLLARAGHQVELAIDGGAALAALDKGHFDIALLDVDMPGSGDAVAKLYRLRHPGGELPLIALATDSGSETQALCLEAGFDAVLTKPLDATRLLATIDKFCVERDRRAPGTPASGQGVTPISAHPRFAMDVAEVVHEQTIESLRGLGGNDFVTEVVDIFRADAARLIPRLRDAVAQGDLAVFGDVVHSLRSGAANIGGVRLCQTLTALEEVTAKDLEQAGLAYVEKVESEIDRLDIALEQFALSHRHG